MMINLTVDMFGKLSFIAGFDGDSINITIANELVDLYEYIFLDCSFDGVTERFALVADSEVENGKTIMEPIDLEGRFKSLGTARFAIGFEHPLLSGERGNMATNIVEIRNGGDTN